MRVPIKAILILLSAVIMQACTSYYPQSFNETTIALTDLSQNNYKVVQLGVQASAETSYFLPIGIGDTMIGIPLRSTDLLEQAMAKIHQKCNLQGRSAVLHNINTEWDTTRVFFFKGSRRVTITADVIEFTGEWVDYGTRDFTKLKSMQKTTYSKKRGN